MRSTRLTPVSSAQMSESNALKVRWQPQPVRWTQGGILRWIQFLDSGGPHTESALDPPIGHSRSDLLDRVVGGICPYLQCPDPVTKGPREFAPGCTTHGRVRYCIPRTYATL